MDFFCTCVCVWECKTGSTGPVYGLIDYYIRGDYYYWVMGMNSQHCTLPGGCITYHWALLQPCCNVLATWYCCHNALTILFCHFVVCSVMIKGPIAQCKPHLDCIPPVSVCACSCIFMLTGSHVFGSHVQTASSVCAFDTHKHSQMLRGVSVSVGGPRFTRK